MPPRDVAGMKESVMRRLLAGEDAKSYKAAAKTYQARVPVNLCTAARVV